MKIEWQTYDDGDIDLQFRPENDTERVLFAALQFKEVDNLGVDPTDGGVSCIRFKEPAHED